jgi:hypothetical protein
VLVHDHQKLFTWCFPLVIYYPVDAATSVLVFQRGGLLQLQAAFPVYSWVLELYGVVSYSQHPYIAGRKALFKLKQALRFKMTVGEPNPLRERQLKTNSLDLGPRN